MLQIKVVEHCFSYKKVSGCICLSPQGVELGGSKDSHVLHIVMYKNRKVDVVSEIRPPFKSTDWRIQDRVQQVDRSPS